MKVFAENKKAHFNYEILEKLQAGLVLIGSEVKSIKAGRMTLDGSYVILKEGAPHLVGSRVPAWQPKNAPDSYDAERTRKLLLNKGEIDYLLGKTSHKGLVLIPLKVYDSHGRIKLEFGLGKGKKKYDKREDIKKREAQREIARRLGRN